MLRTPKHPRRNGLDVYTRAVRNHIAQCIRKTSFTHKKNSTIFYFLLKEGKMQMRTTVLLVAGLFAKAESTSPWSTLFDNVRWPAFVLPRMCCCWLHLMQCLPPPPLTYNFQLLVYRLIVCSVSTLTCRYQKYVVCLRVKSTHDHCST